MKSHARGLTWRMALWLLVCGCLLSSCAPLGSSSAPTSTSRIARLPGEQVWNEGVSSFLFGTNDTYEWQQQNIETMPALQDVLHSAGITLMRSFFPDNASDQDIEQRMATIERSGAQCLGVITNIENSAFDEHLVRYLGPRCQMYEFGNEPDYMGISIEDYLSAWDALIPQLRALNPSARFIGPATSNAQGKDDYMRRFLQGVQRSGVLPDAISFHWYPCWQLTQDACLREAGSYADAVRRVRAVVVGTLGHELPIGISEWNYDPGNPPPSYGEDAHFITTFTQEALLAMKQANVAFACQFDAASYSGYGRLDMLDIATSQPKPQLQVIAALVQRYRPHDANH